MERSSRDFELQGDAGAPLERELAGLPELDRFASESDQAAALRARAPAHRVSVRRGILDLGLGCDRRGTTDWLGTQIRRTTAAVSWRACCRVAGVAVYMLLSRLIIRWGAGPGLQRELAEKERL
jgi:hypothetical protein